MRKVYKAIHDRLDKIELKATPKTKRVFILKRGERIEDYPKQENSKHKRVFIVRRGNA